MKMTFPQYIQNPMGIANSVISNREMYRTMYTEKWNKIMLRENGKVDYTLYKKKNSYIVYLKIPSEVVPNFYYDTIVEFTPPEKSAVVLPTLEKYNVKFYSNDPSFVFTYAHAFIKNELFIEDLKPKMSQLAVKKTATEKNPGNVVGYVKSLYFAWLVIKSRGLLSRTHYTMAKEYNKNELLKLVQDADSKIEERQRAGETLEKRKEKKRLNAGTTNNEAKNRTGNNEFNGIPKVAKTIGNVKKSSKIKSTKKAKKK